MPDITMCKDAECPLSTMCYRFTAAPSDRQSYFAQSPRKDFDCDLFWGEGSQKLMSQLNQILNGDEQTESDQ